MKRVSVLCAALFCAALSAQEAGVHAAGQTEAAAPAAAAQAHEHEKVGAEAAQAHEHEKAGAEAAQVHEHEKAGAEAAQAHEHEKTGAEAAQAHEHEKAGAEAAQVHEHEKAGAEADTAAHQALAAEAPKPDTARPMRHPPALVVGEARADSALGVYTSARNAIRSANRKFPRPPSQGLAAEAEKVPRELEAALISAYGTVRAAWEAMGVRFPPHAHPEQPAAAPQDSVQTADSLPRVAYPQTPAGGPAAKQPAAQAVLGVIVPLGLGAGAGELGFKPWWNMGYHASYREIDADAQFSGGLSIDLSLYTFNEKEYRQYYKFERRDISVSDVKPMFIVDLDYYLKLYFSGRYKIPYVAGSVGICGAFGGSATASYKTMDKGSLPVDGKDEDLVGDVYILRAAAGAGVDVPVYAGIRAFAEVQYSLRLGLYSMFGEDGEFLGGLVPQAPIRFGVVVPFKTISGGF